MLPLCYASLYGITSRKIKISDLYGAAMFRKLTGCLLITLAVSAEAQTADEMVAPRPRQQDASQSYEQAIKRQRELEREDARSYYNQLVGKTYWYKPGVKPPAMFRFRDRLRVDDGTKMIFGNPVEPRKLITFHIVEALATKKTYGHDQFNYRVLFEDGTEAFVQAIAFLPAYTSGVKPIASWGAKHDLASAKDDTQSYVFDVNPLDLIAKDDEQAAAELKAEKLQAQKGGVRIGMSKKQVLNSSWGEPSDINRTITKAGTREQWVYDGSYLYFDNGVLTAIQD
jgi:hypothetical protein